jgi:cytochrome c oxidase subunit 2
MDLFNLMFVLMAVVFVGVWGALIYIILRYRHKGGAPTIPPQTHGNTRLEIAWTIAPALVLIVIMVPTVRDIFQNAQPPEGSNPLPVTVTGHQWWWEFEYPELGVVTANELHMPVGRVVNFSLESADVIHSFWVPKIGGKRDNIPGRTNELWLQGDVPGVYSGQCAELCGDSHANMRFTVIVESQADFDAWIARMKQPPTPPTAEQVKAGEAVFMEARPCWTCHTIAGTKAQGKVGPDLTLFGERDHIASAILPNTAENLDKWIADPPKVKPGAKMPNLGLTDQQRADVIAYLQSLK